MSRGNEREGIQNDPLGAHGRVPGRPYVILMPLPKGHYKIGQRGFGMQSHPIRGGKHFHGGHDMQAKLGTPILAPEDCIVTDVLPNHGDAGNFLKVKGSYGYGFMHLDKFAEGLRRGDKIKQGQIIGYVGSTGLSSGPHLHFEVYSLKNGEKLDPRKMIFSQAQNITLADAQAITGGRTTMASLLAKSAAPLVQQPLAQQEESKARWWEKSAAARPAAPPSPWERQGPRIST